MGDLRETVARKMCWAEGPCANPCCNGECGDAGTAIDCFGRSAEAVLAAIEAAGFVVKERGACQGRAILEQSLCFTDPCPDCAAAGRCLRPADAHEECGEEVSAQLAALAEAGQAIAPARAYPEDRQDADYESEEAGFVPSEDVRLLAALIEKYKP